MVDYSRYNPRLHSNNSDDDRNKHAIRLAVNEFLLNGAVRKFFSGDMELTIQKRYQETLGKLRIPFGSSHSEIYQLTKSFILNNLNNELPDYCIIGYKLCNSLVNINDNIFFTNWEHIVWLETPFIQGFILNDSISIYLLEYDVDEVVVRLLKAITSKKRILIKEYNPFSNPDILARKMIFDIYEGGFEDVSSIPD